MTRLIRWAPLMDPFEEMSKFLGEDGSALSTAKGFAPAVDVYETNDAVIVETPLPGIDPVKADVAIENDVLTIKGESEKKTEVEDKNYYRREIRAGSFFRTVPLPAHVIGDQASATYENGILKVSIPKAPEAKAKTIKVEVKK